MWPFNKKLDKEAEANIPQGSLKNVQAMQSEFQSSLTSLFKTAHTNQTKEEKRKVLRKAIDGLSEDTFVQFIPQIMQIIQKSKDKCEPFANTEEQVADILEMIPRLRQFEGVVELIISERRRKYKLVV